MKRGIAAQTLVKILLVTIAFLVIASLLKFFFFQAEGRTAEAICRGSVAARSKIVIDVKVEEVRTPLLCRSQSIEVGKGKKEEEVMKELAELMVRSWWMYGDGLVEDVFKKGGIFNIKNECAIAYIINMKKWKEYNEGIKTHDFMRYLALTPYKVREKTDSCKRFGGWCEEERICDMKIEENKYFKKDDDTKCKKDNEVCCYSAYDCLNKGGMCEYELDEKEKEIYLEYKEWNCPGEKKCWIKDRNHYTYLEYIQGYGGNGVVVFPMGEDIKPGETYAITFGSPTEDCGKTCRMIGGAVGIVGGAVVCIATGLVPCATAVAIGGIGGYVVGDDVGENLHEAYQKLIKKRGISTIYFSKLNLAEKECTILVD